MLKYESNIITHHKEGEIEYLTFKILDKYKDKLKYGFFLKHGGVSKGIYNSLNFRFIGNDNRENININIKLALKTLKLEKAYKATQNHTLNILELTSKNKEIYETSKVNKDEYDAYIHKDKNIASLVTVADCNPVIIYDKEKNILANIHSGWAGTIKRITIKTAETLVNEYNCKYEDLIICIGPSISKCHFTSKEKEFKDKFMESYYYINEKEYITYDNDNETFHIDLTYLIKYDLIKLGVKKENIKIANICTVCNNQDFFSYRVATKNKEKDYGTCSCIASLI